MLVLLLDVLLFVSAVAFVSAAVVVTSAVVDVEDDVADSFEQPTNSIAIIITAIIIHKIDFFILFSFSFPNLLR